MNSTKLKFYSIYIFLTLYRWSLELPYLTSVWNYFLFICSYYLFFLHLTQLILENIFFIKFLFVHYWYQFAIAMNCMIGFFLWIVVHNEITWKLSNQTLAFHTYEHFRVSHFDPMGQFSSYLSCVTFTSYIRFKGHQRPPVFAQNESLSRNDILLFAIIIFVRNCLDLKLLFGVIKTQSIEWINASHNDDDDDDDDAKV